MSEQDIQGAAPPVIDDLTTDEKESIMKYVSQLMRGITGAVTPIGDRDIQLADTKNLRTGQADDDYYDLSAWDKDGGIYAPVIRLYGGINAPYAEVRTMLQNSTSTAHQFRDGNSTINSDSAGSLRLYGSSRVMVYSSNLVIRQKISHDGDGDTYIEMTPNTLQYVAGNTTGFTQNATGIGFYTTSPIAKQGHIADATDAASAITQLNLLIASIENLGLLATS